MNSSIELLANNARIEHQCTDIIVSPPILYDQA